LLPLDLSLNLIKKFTCFENGLGSSFDESFIVETLQNLINKHIIDLGIVQRNNKKEKGEFIGCQGSSSCQNLYMTKIDHL
jgi:hypothetical protein